MGMIPAFPGPEAVKQGDGKAPTVLADADQFEPMTESQIVGNKIIHLICSLRVLKPNENFPGKTRN